MATGISEKAKTTEREQRILSILEENGVTSVHDLCQKLYLSEATMRRALSLLAKRGLIHRTHGGAELYRTFTVAGPFSSRVLLNASAKRSIAQEAAKLVYDGSIVFLDQSSTAFHLAEALKEKQDLTIITNNIEIASLLSDTSFRIYLSGGYLHETARACLVGTDAQQIFLNTYADFAFFSTRSLSSDGIASDCNREEINIRNAMLKHAKQKVFLCDSSKFGTASGYIQCSLQEVDILISENDAANIYASAFPHLKCL